MNFYITSGTIDYLTKLKNKYLNENMLLLTGSEDDFQAVILHETKHKTVFNHPRKYEVIDSIGSFEKATYVVMNNIPVTDEGKPLFEYQFKNRQRKIEHQPGFVAIRLLRPLSSNTYVILTLWENKRAYENWKSSDSFLESHKKQTKSNEAKSIAIFAGLSYLTTYSIAEVD
ncbi:antibiotic biosynthesis monooxygenase family protein [Mesobacillus maritimus]|uniref:Antibiotic biosynthesis monooxygenase n=1 Tax=Mesobacillus maritimus TaxID=1643336 RepID=A0ABS7JZ64_9BACI|nr:antibiotic biosynthesis monooxygenase [Mesobacillus maritimus]MBY0095264.1 antibiotic biosynthesis monooxygenase [Mesobacillus maritimus]